MRIPKRVFISMICLHALVSMPSAFGEDAGLPDGRNSGIPAPRIIRPSETVVDIDGNAYRTVRIGNQTRMAENLKTTRLNDGTPISLVTGNVEWSNLRTPGYCWPNNDPANKDAYGGLYNWYAVSSGTLAPEGWHVPTDDEWRTLAEYLGGVKIAGGKLKEPGTAHWKKPNGGATNETGFSARGAGVRNSDGSFGYVGELPKCWTATTGGVHAYDSIYWGFNWFDAELGRSSHQKRWAFRPVPEERVGIDPTAPHSRLSSASALVMVTSTTLSREPLPRHTHAPRMLASPLRGR